MDNNSQRKAYDSKRNPKLLADGFFIANNKNRSRDIEDTQSNSKLVILKSIILILLAAIIALIIPMILTGGLNRLVADITHQWYLNGFSRVVITVIVAIVTYSVSYALIRFTTFKKSIVFNVVCFILTFLWAVCMGIAWIPD